MCFQSSTLVNVMRTLQQMLEDATDSFLIFASPLLEHHNTEHHRTSQYLKSQLCSNVSQLCGELTLKTILSPLPLSLSLSLAFSFSLFLSLALPVQKSRPSAAVLQSESRIF